MILPNLVKLVTRLVRDPRVPRRHRMLALGALAYVVSPIDLIPDAVPLLGPLDDVLVVALALRRLIHGAGPEIVDEHWDGGDSALETVDTVIDWVVGLAPPPLQRAMDRLAP